MSGLFKERLRQPSRHQGCATEEKLALWPELMTVAEVATLLNCHEQTIYKAVRRGRIPVIRTFGSLRIDPARLAGWLKQRGA